MPDIYVIDTSSLIELEEIYPRSEYFKVWERLDHLINKGLLKAPRAVYKEISPVNASLYSWAKEKARKKRRVGSHTRGVAQLFVPNDMVSGLASEILSLHPRLVHPYKEYAADQYIIALARTINDDLSDDAAVIVTEERDKPNKIPHVARIYGIRAIGIYIFLKEIGL